MMKPLRGVVVVVVSYEAFYRKREVAEQA